MAHSVGGGFVMCIQRSFAAAVSRTDAEEAEAVGRAAVRHAIDGQTDVIVTLVRTDAETYGCSTGLAPLAEVAGKVKAMPEPYLHGLIGGGAVKPVDP